MTTNLAIYTRDNCEYCRKLKVVLDSFSVKYIQFNLDENFSAEEFYMTFGKDSTFPQVTIDGQKLGGCTETIEYLTSIGCLQEEKDMECVL